MKSQIKTAVLTIVLALFAGSGALAATGGQIPLVSSSNGFISDRSVNDDAYQNHGQDVSGVARDKDAVGTRTNPNGKVIENHGQAVREAARAKGDNDSDGADEAETGDVSTGAPGNSNPPANSNAGGNPPEHSNTGGNPPANSNTAGNSANSHAAE